MRILSITAFYTPFVIGGAEMCAQNLTDWFVANGHEAAVLTAAPTPADEQWGADKDGYKVYRVSTPHLYPVAATNQQPGWKKPIWHMQDILDPRNEAVFDRVIAEFKPDFIHIHWIQGLGYNGLKVIARHGIPTAITLHDLALACVRTTMFRGIDECAGQCGTCKFSAKVKMGYLRQLPRLGFISPSQANLDRVAELLPIDDYPKFHILNPNRYPAPTVRHSPQARTRLLFVGRLEETKGINFLLGILDTLSKDFDFHLTVLGKGPEEPRLREQYGHHDWLELKGHVPQQEVSDIMATSDLLITPSLWAENSPGVVIQALANGLPVMGSDKGGLPELIQPGENGMLVPPGDEALWRAAITDVLRHPEKMAALRESTIRSADRFDYDRLGRQIMAALEHIAAQPARAA